MLSWKLVAGTVAAGSALLLSQTHRHFAPGPEATEHKADPGHPDYDQQLQALWGGPAPQYYYKCFEEWPLKYAAAPGSVVSCSRPV